MEDELKKLGILGDIQITSKEEFINKLITKKVALEVCA